MNAVTKPTPIRALSDTTPEADLIDQFAALHARYESLQDFLKLYEDTKKKVIALAEGDPKKTTQIHSAKHTILLSAARATRKVDDVTAFVSELPWEQALPCLSVSVTAMDKAGIKYPTTTTYGARSIKAVVAK